MPPKKDLKKRKLRQKQKQKQVVKTNVKVNVQSSGGAGGTPSYIPQSFRPDNLVGLVESIGRRLSAPVSVVAPVPAPAPAPVPAPAPEPDYNPQNDAQTVDSVFNKTINTDIPVVLGPNNENFGKVDLEGRSLPKSEQIRVGESPAQFQMRMSERETKLAKRREKGKEQRKKANATVLEAQIVAEGQPTDKKINWE